MGCGRPGPHGHPAGVGGVFGSACPGHGGHRCPGPARQRGHAGTAHRGPQLRRSGNPAHPGCPGAGGGGACRDSPRTGILGPSGRPSQGRRLAHAQSGGYRGL
ncbi:hypothetical protein DESC_10020 [Desulfosarcina cetonica]|nr:hypothetical protein DESC_10020 [Desulfosarcina cetonica]